MKQRITVILCFCLSLLLLFLSTVTVISATSEPSETRDEDIINGHSYYRYNDPVRTYLCKTDNGYMRVYGSDDGTLMAEYYDSSYSCVGNRFIRYGLDVFGGFYAWGGYYYVLSGRMNLSENPFVETFRVTKFNKDWQEVAHGSLFGANTTKPFDAGRADFAVYDDMMIIRTCHEMYYDAETDANHQSNITIRVNINNMSLDGSYYDVLNTTGAGYVSHSFNQFVAIDSDGTVVCLDHGDALPRGAALGRYFTKGKDLVIRKPGYKTYEYFDLIDYYGDHGENITGAMIGGLECSSSSYLTVGTTVAQDRTNLTAKAYNAYISVTDKNNFSSDGTRIIYLTNFKEWSKFYASNPQLVKINNDSFVVMWNEFPVPESYFVTGVKYTYDERYQMKYVFINGEGEMTSDVMTAPQGSMIYTSECEPIVVGNKVLWYVSDGEKNQTIVELSTSGRLKKHAHILPANADVYPIDLSQIRVAFRSFDALPRTVEITEDNLDDYIVVCYRGRILKKGIDYAFSTASSPIRVENRAGYISRVELKLAPVIGRSYFPRIYNYNWAATYNDSAYIFTADRRRDGVYLECLASRGVGYQIYRMDANSMAFELIATVDNSMNDTYLDTTALYANMYAYQIREFTYDKNGNMILSEPSKMKTVEQAPADWPSEPPTEPDKEDPSEDDPTETETSEPNPGTVDPVKLGDIDGDNDVTIVDATVIQRCLVGLVKWDDVNAAAADTDGDGDRTIVDATTIQRFLVGLEKTLPIGQPMIAADGTYM